jgi:hypothetical protein
VLASNVVDHGFVKVNVLASNVVDRGFVKVNVLVSNVVDRGFVKVNVLVSNVFKKQSPGKHVAPFVHIILIPSQPVFALTPECCVLSVEATHNNFIVLGFTQTSLKPTIYYIRGEHGSCLDIAEKLLIWR